ncbi:hypothetical protein [Apilactobacillus apinorum]|uniref:Uncharacterized protein n=1 Tax=Apilactobacillus apinorum TaxID=1218495 RepID=A0ABP9ZG25_9LACO|nr:hypothetical protein [Apilactobacillus apinorum]CAI2607591.1 hypothetical protein AAPFHON13_00620 [Apilactobacillus apinorum]
MIANDLSVQIKLIIMYAIGIIALITLLIGLYKKQYSFRNKNILFIIGVIVVMTLLLLDILFVH